MQNISQDTLRNLYLKVPPIEQQLELLAALSAEANVTGIARANLAQEIALAQELKARLTSDVVTGKLDVRNTHFKTLATSTLDELIEHNIEASMDGDAELETDV